MEISVEVPHDSVFTMKCIPPHFTLRSIPGTVYHHHLKTGVAAPGFTGKLVGSDSLSLKAMTGKKRMLFFFDRFSYPCLKALNAVQQFQNENNDVEVLLIGLDAGESELKGILTKRNLSLKAIENGEPIADKYYISALPAFFFIDEKGIIHKIQNGYGGEVNLRY